MTISPVRGVIPGHGEDEVLAITLPQNVHHFASLLVVTHNDDRKTQLLCRDYYRHGVRCFVTDQDPRRADALEVGVKMLGRDGWLLMLQPNIAVPADVLCTGVFKPGYLHLANGCNPVDFFLFHGSDWRLRRRPWFDHREANSRRSFVSHWPAASRVLLPHRVYQTRKAV